MKYAFVNGFTFFSAHRIGKGLGKKRCTHPWILFCANQPMTKMSQRPKQCPKPCCKWIIKLFSGILSPTHEIKLPAVSCPGWNRWFSTSQKGSVFITYVFLAATTDAQRKKLIRYLRFQERNIKIKCVYLYQKSISSLPISN